MKKQTLTALLALAALCARAGAQTVDTLPVSGLFEPHSVAVDADNNYYVTDSGVNRVVKFVPSTATQSVLAGTEEPGSVDGKGILARFFAPKGIVAARGGLVVADSGNQLIRFVGFDGTVTNIAGASGVPGLADDADPAKARFRTPLGLAADASGNIYIADSKNNAIRKLAPNNQVTTVADASKGLFEPAAIAVGENGQLFVADTRNHSIRVIDPDGTITLVAGSGSRSVSGTDDAVTGSTARFNNPRGIYWAGGNLGLLVSDSGNHTVRRLFFNPAVNAYSVETLAGDAGVPGFANGSGQAAQFNLPVGISRDQVTRSLLVVDSGNYKLRRIQVATVTNPPPVIDVPITVTPPTINPSSGYFPMGQQIVVSSSSPTVYYTTDGTDPTTNSLRLTITNETGVIFWHESLRDLTSLSLKAFIGTNESAVVRGEQVKKNEIGIPRGLAAGVGSSVVVPVVVNLATNQSLRTVQFRVEVTPDGNAPVITEQFRGIPINGNEFVPVVSAGTNAVISSSGYLNGSSRGLAISAIGDQASFNVDRFAAVVMLAVPIPPTATVGQSYQIRVLEPSGTSDAQQTPTLLTATDARVITITNLSYVVGDTAPGGWYNAGDFGNGNLGNNDVNNAFYAALGVRLPYTFSDAFDAMDAFPVDSGVSVGGDGEIRFLDWQRILRRSLRLEAANWSRAWGPGGFRVAQSATLTSAANSSAAGKAAVTTAATWNRQALIGAGALGNVTPGDSVSVPVYVKVASGAKLSGLLFNAVVSPEADAPALSGSVKFVVAPGLPGGTPASFNANSIGYGWNIGAFSPALTGSNLLGFVEFSTPALARSGHTYAIHFTKADGSPDLDTQYDLETAAGQVVIAAAAASTGHFVSEEWQRNYFGSTSSAAAQPEADPDGDGIPNWSEYASGTNPNDAQSWLRLALEESGSGVTVKWQSALGRVYILERSSSITDPVWTPVGSSLPGDGGVLSMTDTNPAAGAAFYRVRVTTP